MQHFTAFFEDFYSRHSLERESPAGDRPWYDHRNDPWISRLKTFYLAELLIQLAFYEYWIYP